MNLDLMTSLYVFMLAAFIGFEVIRRVSPLLHTPLMSLTNALDAIAVVGAIILVGEGRSTLATVFGTIAIVAAMSNVVGGFLITDRMLRMFKASSLEKVRTAMIRQRTPHRARLPGRHGPVHPRPEMDELADARRGAASAQVSWGCCWPSWERCSIMASSTTRGSPSGWCSARSSAYRSAWCR